MAINRALVRKQASNVLINTVFGLEVKRYQEEWKEIFELSSESKLPWVEDVLMGGFSGATIKGEGAAGQYQDAQESYTARYVFDTLALHFAVTEEAEEDGQFNSLISTMTKELTRAFMHTTDQRGADILNNGFDTNYAGGDGVPLFSASHPTISDGNQSNILATAADLTHEAVEDMLILIGDSQNDKGIPLALMPKKLVIANANQFEAARILNSVQMPDTANNAINPVKGLISGGFCVNRRLTDPDAWFILTDCPNGLKRIVRKKLEIKSEGDFESGNMRVKGRMRDAFGWSNWRGIYGTAGA